MQALKSLGKNVFSAIGLTVARRDQLAEQIPADYLRSPYLPHIYRHSLARLIYFEEMFKRIEGTSGDIVECGVSIGAGILNWALLSDLANSNRRVIGFDSFSGFPPSSEPDRKMNQMFHTHEGEYASPPELVLRILEHGRVSPTFLMSNVDLRRGYFQTTLPQYRGEIALLHLDCDLYESYQVCLRELYRSVVPGGIIMFDEYEDKNFPGARRAVDEFFAGKREQLERYEKYQYVKYYVIKSAS